MQLAESYLAFPPATDGDRYLRQLLSREAPASGAFGPGELEKMVISPLIQEWANGNLIDISLSGSAAKGTANKSGTDVDLFISLSPETPETLEEIYEKLDRKLRLAGYVTRRQNVSINVTILGSSVDLVPGRLQHFFLSDHSLWLSKGQTWRKTNINQHISLVRNSGRQEEIRVLKLWRDQWSLEFPSIYLELTVLAALGQRLAGAPWGALAANVSTVFEYLRDKFETAQVIDPANSNNCISDELTASEKKAVSVAAMTSRNLAYWRDIVR
jgi:hypothetical protein